ncbi:MAG: C10 family peptidase [Bacteroidaceae bacterium]|nr:C10 family peptidase [Bacteroidaceae bacterium]
MTIVCFGQRRTFDQACEIAAAKLSVSATSLQATLSPYARSKGYVSADAAAEQPYYILHPQQGEGFVIVSGDERMTPVLAYSREGTFSPDSLPDNLRAWLQLYATEYEQIVEDKGERDNSKLSKSNSYVVGSTEGVEPFLHTMWGQYDPYNRLCPEYKAGSRSATGCGATAMAQCMYYYHYPDCAHGSNSYTTKTKKFNLSWNFDDHPIQWSLMKEDYPASGTSEEEGQAIAELFFGCGVSVNMDYDEESGSQHGTLMSSLNQYYGYDDDMAILKRERMSDEAWHTVLIEELEARRPLLTAAWTESGAGHMFVIHGYQRGDEGTPAYYINWGWRGRYDGYYVMPNLCYDGVEHNALSEDISVIIGLQPEDGIHNRANTIQIKEITSNKNSINLDSGNLLDLRLSNLYSASLKAFNGEMRVYMVDGDGIKTRIASAGVNLRQGMETSINLYSITVPETVESGIYTLQCYAYDVTTGTETSVMSHSTTTITITNIAADYRAAVAASHIQVTKTDERELTLSATNVMNTADLSFIGTMQMLVSDYVTGRNITTFGNTLTFEELEKGHYFARTDTYSGILPSDLSDGAYRLNLGARQSNYTNWGKGK